MIEVDNRSENKADLSKFCNRYWTWIVLFAGCFFLIAIIAPMVPNNRFDLQVKERIEGFGGSLGTVVPKKSSYRPIPTKMRDVIPFFASYEVWTLRDAETLHFNSATITDSDLVYLQDLKYLQELSFYNMNISDAGIIHLEKMTTLKRLNLSNTKITDAGLVHLSRLHKLRYLGLADTHVTRAGAEKLRLELPNCDIYWTAK